MHPTTFIKITPITTLLRLVSVLIILALSLPADSAEKATGFDHFSTGFPLVGRHALIDCSSCHLAGQFKGTPMECGLCHNNTRAPGKHPEHFPSSNFCDDCHTEFSWKGARFDHSDVQGACQSCHNNSTAIGKPPSHIQSSLLCEDCHNTITFSRVIRVDHSSVIGTCSSCHNGVTATGKHPQHTPTTAECDTCHFTTISFRGAVFDHSNITQPCSNCHNGVTATGKYPGHILTTADCSTCHFSTSTWLGAVFDHSNITQPCSSCHDGVTATGKNTTHFVTSLDCGNCHTPTNWLQLLLYRHDSPDYPGDHRTATLCVDCHTTNNQTVVWPFTAYKPECAGCHANDYDIAKHGNTTLVPGSEFADCSGSCHINGQLRSPQHRTGDGSW